MRQKPDGQDRWREGVKQRLDAIQAELRELGVGIDQRLDALTERLGEDERRAGRHQ